VRLDIRRIGSIKRTTVIGNEKRVKVVKNKGFAPPFRRVSSTFFTASVSSGLIVRRGRCEIKLN